jgi:hypothetical protein
MEQTQCSETLEFKLQTPGNNPEKAYDLMLCHYHGLLYLDYYYYYLF